MSVSALLTIARIEHSRSAAAAVRVAFVGRVGSTRAELQRLSGHRLQKSREAVDTGESLL